VGDYSSSLLLHSAQALVQALAQALAQSLLAQLYPHHFLITWFGFCFGFGQYK
jgi:hypothetical protein